MLIAGAFLFPLTACSASFDCSKAASPTEKLICNNESVSKLDEQLASAYKQTLESATDKDAIKKAQLEWLKQQRACKEAECLTQAYQARIAELNNPAVAIAQSPISASSTGTPSKPNSSVDGNKKPLTFKLVYGDSYPICQPYVDMLNKTKYTEYPACERKILPEFSQFKAVQWTEITDKNEMIQTLKDLMDVEFAKMGKFNSDFHKSSFDDAKARVQSGETKLYISSFDIGDDGDVETLYKETWFYAKAEVPKDCTTRVIIHVKDKKITLENAREFYGSPYRSLSLDGNNYLFTFGSYLYSSNSSGLRDPYDISIFGTNEEDKNTHAHLPVCGINAQ